MNKLIVVEINGENRIDSRLVAKSLGIEHKSFMETIRKYQGRLERRGLLPFQQAVRNKVKGADVPQPNVLLNRDQLLLIASKVRNTEASLNFKEALVDVFLCPDYENQAMIIPLPQETQKKLREVDIQRDFAEYLQSQGKEVQREVKCLAGVADIVTDDAIYEIKNTLTAKSIFEAIGQVLVYRFCIKPDARAIIVGRYAEDVDKLRITVESMGIEIIIW